MTTPTTIAIETPTHGRVLLRETPGAPLVLVGFHGYGETAEIQMDRLLGLPGSDEWTLVSVQGLHRFYRGRTQEICASWMTRQDRELAIADNIAYVDRVVERLVPRTSRFALAGFSQGVAMAFRAGVRGARAADGIIAVGGDVPPELLADDSAAFPPTVLIRGSGDTWYTAGKLASDVAGLEARGTDVQSHTCDAGHEWTGEVSRRAGAFIRQILHRGSS